MNQITNRVATLLTKEFLGRSPEFKDGFTTALKFVEIGLSKEPVFNSNLKIAELEKEAEELRYKLRDTNRKLERFEGLEPERNLLLQQIQSLRANNANEKNQVRHGIAKKVMGILSRDKKKDKIKAIKDLFGQWYRLYDGREFDASHLTLKEIEGINSLLEEPSLTEQAA